MADVKLAQPPIHAFFFIPPIEDNWIGHIVSEIWKDKIYQPYIGGKKDLVIVDVGSNLGFTSYYFSQFAKIVYSLEPSFEHFDILTRMIAFNGLNNVVPINKAIYTKSGKYPFGGPKDNKTMRSLHMATWNKGKADEEVDAITLPELFKEQNIEHVDLLKLDVEGSEMEILSSETFKQVAPKIDLIIGERHRWNGRHPNQLNEALKNAGFNVEQLENDADIFVARRKR